MKVNSLTPRPLKGPRVHTVLRGWVDSRTGLNPCLTVSECNSDSSVARSCRCAILAIPANYWT